MNYASIGNGSTPRNQVQMSILDLAAIRRHVESGKLLALAMTGPQRWPGWDVPTFAEQGYAIDMAGWNGIMAPAGTPAAIVERMSAELARAVQSPEGREQMLKMGLLPTGTTPQAFAQVIRRDPQGWGEVIRKTGIKLE